MITCVPGVDTRPIAHILTRNGIRATQGREWDEATISAILSNTFYASEIEHHGVVFRQSHEPIVNRGLFHECRMRMEEERHREDMLREAAAGR